MCYAAAFNSELLGEMNARLSLNNMLEDIFIECNDRDFKLFLTGKTNFRYNIYPEYKAHRKEQVKPKYLPVCIEHLIAEWGATVSDGCEADDMVGVEHYATDCASTIVHIDKDLNMFSGWHYNPRRKERYLVSPMDALRCFYTQLLQGDVSDNIKGAKGIGKVKAERLLQYCSTEPEMFDVCRQQYGCDEELKMNAQCLWLWRKMDDTWKWPEWAEPFDG